MKGVKDAFARLSGAKETTINLADGLITATIDPAQPVTPAHFWKEVRRVGFVPEQMDVWAAGTFDGHSFALDGGRWALKKQGPKGDDRRQVHFRILNGAEDPPQVEVLE